jgi:hypothetical protein
MSAPIVAFDATAPAGEKFVSEAVRDEIGEVAVTEIPPGGIAEIHLAAGAVTESKLGAGAVTAGKIGAGAVATAALASDAVTGDKIDEDAVAPEHAGPGIPTAHNNVADPITLDLVTLTAVQFAALTPNPSALYFIT